jgi:hypothetical protein
MMTLGALHNIINSNGKNIENIFDHAFSFLDLFRKSC